mgnify:CR=1 FL=1
MRDHLAACESCAGFDAQMRRALMVARSSPTFALSPGFRRRLEVRLAVERLAHPAVARTPVLGWRATAIAAAAVVMIATGLGLAGRAALRPQPAVLLVLAPIVVTPPALPTEPVAAPAMFATVSSSLPVYPAMLLAQRATEQFAAAHARTVSFQATH